MLKHVVMIKLKEGCNTDRCHELLMGCRAHIPEVRGISAGNDVVRTPTSYDYCFVLTFDDLQGLQNYEASDYHQLIRNEIRRIRTVSHAVDFLE